MQVVASDIATSKTGNKYILVVSDYFIRWVEAFVIPNQEAVTVAKTLIDNMFCWSISVYRMHMNWSTRTKNS